MILIECPNCGPRNAQEFHHGGEYNPRPLEPLTLHPDEWADHLYMRANTQGLQKEWWYHRAGCRLWFLAERHTKTNVIERTYYWRENPPKSERDRS
jgi:heterotetrameric sarcosine oxidase delta subunit